MNEATKELNVDTVELNIKEKQDNVTEDINSDDADDIPELSTNTSNISDNNSVQKCLPNIDQIDNKSKEEVINICKQMNSYIEFLQHKSSSVEADVPSFQEFQKREKLLRDSSYREKILIRRLAVKEHEIQEYISQLRELKAAQIPSVANLKSALLDPALNVIFQKLKTELIETKEKLEETQNELNAWKFTPDSNTGKRLMAKCRLLHQENEELGKIISSGRVAKLEGELALQKSFSEDIKRSQFELDDLLQDLDEDVEGMQGTIHYLQQELKKSNEITSSLQNENSQLRQELSSIKSINDNLDEKNESSRLSPLHELSPTVNSVDNDVKEDESSNLSGENNSDDTNKNEEIAIVERSIDEEIIDSSSPPLKKQKTDEK